MTHTNQDLKNHWIAVLIAVLSGVVGALQIGKLPIAAPLLQAELGVSRSVIGNLGAIFPILGMLAGIPIGTMVLRIGLRYSIALGLATIAISSLLAPLFPTVGMLYLLRLIEGFGFIFIVVSAPTLIQGSVQLAYRNTALSFWGTFMPIGISLMMFLGPLFSHWQGLWYMNGIVALLAVVLILLFVPAPHSRPKALSLPQIKSMLSNIFKAGVPLRMALAFGCYTLMYFALFNFLPLLLIEELGLGYGQAGIIAGFASAANIFGNLAAGRLLSKGHARRVLVPLAFIVMIMTGTTVFTFPLPVVVVAFLCIIFAGVGGIIPTSVLSSAPIVSPTPMAIPITVGLIMQGSNMGQSFGPLLAGWSTQFWGWTSAAWILLVVGIMGIFLIRYKRIDI